MQLLHAVRALAAVLIVSGVLALFMPATVADFAGLQIEIGSGNGRVEVGAVYGGVPIALGAIALYATLSASSSAGPMLASVGWVFVGAALARVFVAFVVGPGTLTVFGWLLLGFDAIAAALCLIGTRALDMSPP
jgi:hypothetical protein